MSKFINSIFNIFNFIKKRKTIVAKDNRHLRSLVKKEIREKGIHCNLNHIDVSQVKDMSYIFYNTHFFGDMSNWDVSNVVNFDSMFEMASLNSDLSKWDTSSAHTMLSMFESSEFNGDISKWNVENVNIMSRMFFKSEFNQDISGWNVSNVKYMNFMFESSIFNQDLTSWEPMSLLNEDDKDKRKEIFNDCPAPIPYWANVVDTPAAVNSYILHNKLNSDLITKSKKNKIKI